MFEYYGNTLCVHASWLYEDAKIMSKSNYKWLCSKGKMTKLTIGGNGRKALVAFESIPQRFKDLIIDQVGDPYEQTKHILFRDYIKPDYKAEAFYRDYTLEDGSALPEDTQMEYTHTSMILNTCHYIMTNVVTCRKFGGKLKAWKRMAEAVAKLPEHTYKHKLPRNYRRLKQRYKAYLENGYKELIHGNFLNNNADKLTEDGTRWVLARWANQVNKCANLAQLHAEYNDIADQKGWKFIKEEKTFYNFLYSEEIMPLWYGYRYGELAAKEKFSYQLKTKMPAFRDSLWFSDGTKLNFYYLNDKGEMATCQVYEVMDAFSEVLLGFHISPTENYEAQYSAYKMAIQTAGYRPYQIKYDNQGGHGKLQAGNFLSKIAKIQTATQPYNGKSKTIESLFGRFQQQYLKRDWFFTGQNITAKKQESKANMEMILANKANLPTLEEVKKIYEQRRREWNSAPHHKTGKPRIDMYYESQNPDTKKVEIWDMIEMFWVTRPKTIKADASGVSFQESRTKYEYMVYDENGMPDLEWLEKSVGKSFTVKYDPEDMSEVRLYEDTPLGLRFVTVAQTKKEVGRAMQMQENWEQSHIRKVLSANANKRIETRDKMEEILAEFEMTAEQQGLNRPNIKGIERNKRGRKKAGEIGEYQKKVSNQDWDDEAAYVELEDIDISNRL